MKTVLGLTLLVVIGLALIGGVAFNSNWSIDAPLLFVSPETGNTPLTVQITTNPHKDPGGREYIDYGDGTGEAAHGFADPHETHIFKHIYTKPGTYTITLLGYYIYDRRDPSYAKNPEIFRQPGAQTDPQNPHQVLVPHPLGSQVIVVLPEK